MLIPLEAISEEDNESWLYKVMEGDEGINTVEKIEVDLIDRNVSYAAIESADLTEGDNIVITNLEALTDGDAVNIQNFEDSN